MHCVFSLLGGTVIGPNCTVYDSVPAPESVWVTSPSTGEASALMPPLLPPLLEAPPPELPVPPLLLLPPPPPFPPEPDELHAAMTTAHRSANREERIRLPPTIERA